MKRFLAIFSDSAKELTNLRCIVMTGMLIAVHVLLSIFVMIPIGENIKISFSFLALASIGMLFGPIPAAIAGGITDILGFMLANKTGGAYHPGFTLVQIMAGFICAISKILVVLICNLCLNTYFICALYGTGSFWAMFTSRIIKNAIQLPVDVVLLSIVMPIILMAYRKVFGIKKAV